MARPTGLGLRRRSRSPTTSLAFAGLGLRALASSRPLAEPRSLLWELGRQHSFKTTEPRWGTFGGSPMSTERQNSAAAMIVDVLDHITAAWRGGRPEAMADFLDEHVGMAFPGFTGHLVGRQALVDSFAAFSREARVHEVPGRAQSGLTGRVGWPSRSIRSKWSMSVRATNGDRRGGTSGSSSIGERSGSLSGARCRRSRRSLPVP